MKKPVILISIAAAIGVGIILFALFGVKLWVVGTECYVQISNQNAEHNDGGRDGVIDVKGGMPYIYHLSAYDENGEEQSVSFGTSRELREGAFLRLKVVAVRGVTDWEEVAFEDLPEAVREKFSD